MRYLVLSDIHSNLDALDTVLRAAAAQKYTGVLVLGDLVGYGADPNAVIERIRDLKPRAIIRGNHDKVAAGLEDAEDFNPVARAAAHWTQQALSPAASAFLRDLPAGPLIVDDLIEICHGSPMDEDLYVVGDVDAIHSIGESRRPVCLFGHTHIAMYACLDGERRLEVEVPQGSPEFSVVLRPEAKYLINPGSVGQPRDGDARAAYAIVDVEQGTATLYRVAYPIEAAQRKIVAAGLPQMLAARLAMGK